MARPAKIAVAGVGALLSVCAPASAAWTKPFDITPRNGFTVGLYDIAVDRGRDVAALGDTLTAPDGLVAYSSEDRGPFAGEEVVGFSVEFPSICFDQAGATLVLAAGDAPAPVRVYSRPRGGRFGPGQVVDGQPGAPRTITTSPTGEVFAVWSRAGGGGIAVGPVRVAVRPAHGKTFGPAQALPRRHVRSRDPRIVFDRRGNALATWVAAGRLEYAIRHPGGKFGGVRVLERAVGDDYAIASNRSGRAVAVWRSRTGRRRSVRAALGTVGSGFGRTERIGGRANRGPVVALDRAGDAIAAWRGGTYPRYRLRGAIARAGEPRFDSSSLLSKRRPDRFGVAVDGRGTQTIAWHERASIRVARHESGSRRFKRQRVADSGARDVSVDGTGNGRTVVAWKAFVKGGRKRVKVAVADGGQPFGPPTRLTRFSRHQLVDGPFVEGRGGGAFVWWSTGLKRADSEWQAGSYLVP